MMSRHSRLPRESIFTGAQDIHKTDPFETFSTSLLECVQLCEDICAETTDAQQLLRNGTFDLPRMKRVLENQRVYAFVSESTVKKYKADLDEEIEPQITELIERAKRGLKALERQHHTLKAKTQNIPVAAAATNRSASARIEARRMQVLTSHKQSIEQELEELKEEIDALEKGDYDTSA